MAYFRSEIEIFLAGKCNNHWVNSFFASSANHLNPVSCLTDAGLGMFTLLYKTLYNPYTYYLASLILVSQDLEIEESG